MNLLINKTLTKKLFPSKGGSLQALFSSNKLPWEILEELERFIQAPTQLSEDVFVEGLVFVGKGTIIRSGACLRGPVVIGEGCVIGHHVEIVRSVIFDGAKIPHLNYVGDSVIGSGVNLGAGSICANVRLDKGEISICGVNTGRKKLGALIGDGASVGCNAVLNPGAVLLPGAVVGPCKNVGGVVQ